jgi:NADP-dependent 3-hydroxy acid dehydrogenase YdfG
MLDPERVAAAVAFALEQPPSVLVEAIELGHVSGSL